MVKISSESLLIIRYANGIGTKQCVGVEEGLSLSTESRHEQRPTMQSMGCYQEDILIQILISKMENVDMVNRDFDRLVPPAGLYRISLG